MANKILSLVAGFQQGFEPKIHSARLYEAFSEISKQLGLGSSSNADKHYSRAYSSVVVNVPNAAATPIPFNQTRVQNGGLHSNSAQNTRFTIFRAGLYYISAHVQWPAVVAGYRQLQIQLNGAIVLASLTDDSLAAAPNIIDQSLSTGMYLSVADYIEIIAFQNSGGAINIPVAAQYSPEAFIMEN